MKQDISLTNIIMFFPCLERLARVSGTVYLRSITLHICAQASSQKINIALFLDILDKQHIR